MARGTLVAKIAGVYPFERIPGMPYACGGQGNSEEVANGVVYVAREETRLTAAQLQQHFGIAVEGRLFLAEDTMTGAMPRSGGTVYFGDMCFAYRANSPITVQVTGSFWSNSQGWTLSKGTQIMWLTMPSRFTQHRLRRSDRGSRTESGWDWRRRGSCYLRAETRSAQSRARLVQIHRHWQFVLGADLSAAAICSRLDWIHRFGRIESRDPISWPRHDGCGWHLGVYGNPSRASAAGHSSGSRSTDDSPSQASPGVGVCWDASAVHWLVAGGSRFGRPHSRRTQECGVGRSRLHGRLAVFQQVKRSAKHLSRLERLGQRVTVLSSRALVLQQMSSCAIRGTKR